MLTVTVLVVTERAEADGAVLRPRPTTVSSTVASGRMRMNRGYAVCRRVSPCVAGWGG